METTYEIRTLNPAPSMCESVELFTGTYAAAVAACHASYRRTGRRTAVVSYTQYWHIVRDGVATDRNFNSGVPATQRIE
jgi:hypothetical protein